MSSPEFLFLPPCCGVRIQGDDGGPVVQNNTLVGIIYINYYAKNIASTFCSQGKYAVAVMTAPVLDWMKKKEKLNN